MKKKTKPKAPKSSRKLPILVAIVLVIFAYRTFIGSPELPSSSPSDSKQASSPPSSLKPVSNPPPGIVMSTPSNTAKADPDVVVDEMEWFYKRFGTGLEFDEKTFTINSFSKEEYQKLLTVATKGSEAAQLALKFTLYEHLKNHPDDPNFQDYKDTLYSKEFVHSLAADYQPWIYDYLPRDLAPKRLDYMEWIETGSLHYYNLPENLKQDKDFVLLSLQKSAEVAWVIPPQLWADKDVALKAVSTHKRLLKNAAPSLQDDKDVVRAALRMDPCNFKWASPRLREDREFLNMGDLNCPDQAD